MKSSLWVVIVVVTGIVGFLVGYSISSATGSTHALTKQGAGGHGAGGATAGYGTAAPSGPGYGGQPAKPVSTGGYR